MALAQYESAVHGISIKYPKTWTPVENAGGAIVAFSPRPGAGAPSLNVVIQDLSSQPLSLEDFAEVSMFQMKQLLPDTNYINHHSTMLAGFQAVHLEYTANVTDTLLKFMQEFTLKDNFAYILTYSAPESQYDTYANLINLCVPTFQITERRGVSSMVLAPYFNKSHSYYMRVPQTWKKAENRNGNIVKFDFVSKQGVSLISFFVNVDEVKDISLAKYSDLVKAHIHEAKSIRSPVEIKDFKFSDGTDGKYATFFSDSLALPGRYVQYWAVSQGKAVVLTFIHAVEESDKEQDIYQPLFDRMVDSLRFNASGVHDKSLRYENVTNKFYIHYPEENYTLTEGFMGATVSFVSKDAPTHQGFSANLNVIVQDMQEDEMTLEQFVDMLKTGQEQSVQNFQHISETPITIVGTVGREIRYAGQIDKLQIMFIQRVVVIGKKAVVLNFAAERDKFDAEYKAFGRYVETFSFI